MNNDGSSVIMTPRFRTAIHVLFVLANNKCVQSSASLAGHVDSHAAFLRRVLLPFVQAGMVEAREGRDGGYVLKISPTELTLAHIFVLVNSETPAETAHACCEETETPLDRAIQEIAHNAERRMIETLGQHTLADLLQRFDVSHSLKCE